MKKELESLLYEILLRLNKIEEREIWYLKAFKELLTNFVPQSEILMQVDSMLQSETSKNKKTEGSKLIDVQAQVVALLEKFPSGKWTSDELAKKIGCTGAAVRKTRAWQGYKKQQRQCSVHKGFKDKNGNINAISEDDEIDDDFMGEK